MTKYSYYTVVFNHETGRYFVDGDIISELTDGCMFDTESEEWSYPDPETSDGITDALGLKKIHDAIEKITKEKE